MEDLPIFSSTELSESSLRELLPDFFDEINEDYCLMKKALQDREYSQIQKLAHKIKGTTASYGATLMSERARMLQENSDPMALKELTELVEELKKAIKTSYEYAIIKFDLI